MLRRWSTRLFAALLLLGLAPASGARANDGVMGGSGSDLLPMKTSDVSMASEDITLTAIEDQIEVDARYVFRNGKELPVTLQLGFPEYRCEDTEGDCVNPDAFRFQDMKTEVRGQVVAHRKGKVSRKHAWAPRLGTVWLFDVTFAPHEEVAVRHTYRVPSGYISDGSRETTYVTRTGALWAGPIGRARFTVRVPLRSVDFQGPEGLGAPVLQPVLPVAEGTKPLMAVTYELRNFAPEGDLSFAYIEGHSPLQIDDGHRDFAPDGPARSGLGPEARCENFLGLWRLGYALADKRDAPPTPAEISAELERGVNDPRICRNMVFAVYGRRFEDEQLNRYYYGAKGFVSGTWPFDMLEPNPMFDPSVLRAGDHETIALTKRLPARASSAEATQANSDAPSPSATSTPAATKAPGKTPAPAPASSPDHDGCDAGEPDDPALFALALVAMLARARRGVRLQRAIKSPNTVAVQPSTISKKPTPPA